MGKRTSAQISVEQEVLRAELAALEAKADEEWTQEDIDRSADIAEDFDILEKERRAALEHEARLDVVRSAALNPANTEPTTAPRSAEFMQRVQPFAGDEPVQEMSRSQARDKALKAIEVQRTDMISDSNRDRLDTLISRKRTEFDGDYVARRILLTENDAYRSAFVKQTLWGSVSALTAEESVAVSAFQQFEVQRAQSEGTSSAGGYGVPVKVAA